MNGITTPPPVAGKALDSRSQRVKPIIARLKDFFKSLGPLGQRKFSRKVENLRTMAVRSGLKAVGGALSLGAPEDADGPAGGVIEDLEVEGSDIVQDSGASIFQIITNRYLKKFMAE